MHGYYWRHQKSYQGIQIVRILATLDDNMQTKYYSILKLKRYNIVVGVSF